MNTEDLSPETIRFRLTNGLSHLQVGELLNDRVVDGDVIQDWVIPIRNRSSMQGGWSRERWVFRQQGTRFLFYRFAVKDASRVGAEEQFADPGFEAWIQAVLAAVEVYS